MLEVKDVNTWLKPPEPASEYHVDSVQALGEYLVITYVNLGVRDQAGCVINYTRVQVYLNSDGREVLRVSEPYLVPFPEVTWNAEWNAEPEPEPPSRWQRFLSVLESMFQ